MKSILKAVKKTAVSVATAIGLDSRLETTSYEITSPKIPVAFDGFKIAHISDYHSDTLPGLTAAVLAVKPDIIVSTGDLTDDKGSYTPAVKLCQRLIHLAPVYAVTGNHDLWREDREEFERTVKDMGVTMLHNEGTALEKNGENIFLYGIDDPFTLNLKKSKERVREYASRIEKKDGYGILLFHRANLFDSVKDYGFDLVLAGHMHGGQVRIPKALTKSNNSIGLAAPSSGWASGEILFPKYTAGIYSGDDCQMIVSRGLGNPMIIPRIYNRPELVTITLRHE